MSGPNLAEPKHIVHLSPSSVYVYIEERGRRHKQKGVEGVLP